MATDVRRSGPIRASPLALLLVLIAASCTDDDPTVEGGAVPASTTAAPALTAPQASPLPEARTEVAGASWNGMVAVVGGLTLDGMASKRLDLYQPAANVWTLGPPLPVTLHHVGVALLGDRLYVAGGYTNVPGSQEWVAQSRVLSLGPGEEQWREEPPLSEPRGALALAASGPRLVAVGGVLASGPTGRTEIFTPGEGWRPGPDLSQPREHLAAAAGAGGRVYAIAGRVGTLESNLSSVESLDPAAPDAWRPEPPLNDRRGGIAAAAVGDAVCVAGGEAPNVTIASVECLRGDRWQRVGILSLARHGLAVVAEGNRLRVIGGGPAPGLTVSEAHEVLVV